MSLPSVVRTMSAPNFPWKHTLQYSMALAIALTPLLYTKQLEPIFIHSGGHETGRTKNTNNNGVNFEAPKLELGAMNTEHKPTKVIRGRGKQRKLL